MASKIVERIAAEVGVPRLFSVLSENISPSDLQSLLMEVYQARTARLRERDLTARAGRSLLAASKIDARVLHEFDHVAFRVAEGFEAVELSPVGPLGLNRVLGGIDQNSVLTTIRNAEVLGDSTMPLALECWRRRREAESRAGVVRLCSSHRVVRLQPFDFPGYVPHFRLFALVSAGRDTGSNTFEIQHVAEHIRFYLRLFQALNEHGFRFERPLVEISDTAVTRALVAAHGVSADQLRQAIRAHRPGASEQFLSERGIALPSVVEDPGRELGQIAARHNLEGSVRRLVLLRARVGEMLAGEFPEAQLRFNFARLEGLAYYSGLCLRISPAAADGERYPIVDGGFTDWTARMLPDRKERLLTSGIGSEFACGRYVAVGKKKSGDTPAEIER